MPKVTYLLGAGASANCLPTVERIPDKLNKFREELVHLVLDPTEELALIPDFTMAGARDALVTDCEELHGMASDHASIDTYAKKVFIKKHMHDYLSPVLYSGMIFRTL